MAKKKAKVDKRDPPIAIASSSQNIVKQKTACVGDKAKTKGIQEAAMVAPLSETREIICISSSEEDNDGEEDPPLPLKNNVPTNTKGVPLGETRSSCSNAVVDRQELWPYERPPVYSSQHQGQHATSWHWNLAPDGSFSTANTEMMRRRFQQNVTGQQSTKGYINTMLRPDHLGSMSPEQLQAEIQKQQLKPFNHHQQQSQGPI